MSSTRRRTRYQPQNNESQSTSARVLAVMNAAPVVQVSFADRLATLQQLANVIVELQSSDDAAKIIKIAALTAVLRDEINTLQQQIDTNTVRLNALNDADSKLDEQINTVTANINELLSDMGQPTSPTLR